MDIKHLKITMGSDYSSKPAKFSEPIEIRATQFDVIALNKEQHKQTLELSLFKTAFK